MLYQGAKSTGATVEPCLRPELSNLSMTKPAAKHLALGVPAGKWITQSRIRAAGEAALSKMCEIDRFERSCGQTTK